TGCPDGVARLEEVDRDGAVGRVDQRPARQAYGTRDAEHLFLRGDADLTGQSVDGALVMRRLTAGGVALGGDVELVLVVAQRLYVDAIQHLPLAVDLQLVRVGERRLTGKPGPRSDGSKGRRIGLDGRELLDRLLLLVTMCDRVFVRVTEMERPELVDQQVADVGRRQCG